MSRCASPSLKLLTIAIMAVLPALSAYAGPQSATLQRERGQQDSRQDRDQSRDNSSLSDAVRRVERDTRGEVLSAERVQYDGRDMHRVKVVDDEGRVRIFMQDPNRRIDNNRNDNSSGSGQGNDRGNNSKHREPPTRDNDD
jgi:hypothetical protein